jgi:hypothetical protein
MCVTPMHAPRLLLRDACGACVHSATPVCELTFSRLARRAEALVTSTEADDAQTSYSSGSAGRGGRTVALECLHGEGDNVSTSITVTSICNSLGGVAV